MASSREPRATAGQAAARLGAEDEWGVASAARHWSSLRSTGALGQAADSHGTGAVGELDGPGQPIVVSQSLPDATAGEALPVKTRVRVWWPTARAWFLGKISKVKVHDGFYIHFIKYDDGDGDNWYNLADPQHTWEVLPHDAAAARAASTSAGEVLASPKLLERGEVRRVKGD